MPLSDGSRCLSLDGLNKHKKTLFRISMTLKQKPADGPENMFSKEDSHLKFCQMQPNF